MMKKQIQTSTLLAIVIFSVACGPNDKTSSFDSGSGFDLCIGSCPDVKRGNMLVNREIYKLSNNPKTKFADWVAYRVSPSSIGPSKTRNWKPDPDLPKGSTLEPSDYKGANDKLEIDRGHQVPLASFANTEHWKETNYLSNITPQRSDLNQGPWGYLEQKVRNLTKDRYRYTWVISGPVYEYFLGELPEADETHLVPSGYWKVVGIVNDGEISIASFFFDQETSRESDICDHLEPLSTIEKRSKLDLLSDYKALELNRNDFAAEELGCI